MKFEWDDEKNHTNKAKHGIDFNEAKALWNDINRVEIQTSYPLENRNILIGKVDRKLWTAIFTRRGNAIRIMRPLQNCHFLVMRCQASIFNPRNT